MSDWMYDLPVAWMALVVFVATYLVAGASAGPSCSWQKASARVC
jgi:hypothetical protein